MNFKPITKPHSLFASRHERLVFVVCVLAGIISSVLCQPLLNGYAYNFGKGLAGAFVPPLLTVAYLTYAGQAKGFTKNVLAKAFALYLLQLSPLFPLFLQTFVPTPYDDFNRYFNYAANMVKNKTLWGGDKLYFPDAGYHYVTQPGYRYFIAFELLLFGKLYRFVQFFNIAVYLAALFLLQRTVAMQIKNAKLRWAVFALIFLSCPYAVKNVLMGLPEWFSAALLFTTAYLLTLKHKPVLAATLLALVPFFRQNLLIAVVLLLGWMLWQQNKPWRLLLPFVATLLLPLYHNLYYAGKWVFFVDVFEIPFLHSSSVASSKGIDFSFLANNLLHYLGWELDGGRVRPLLLAAVFLPLSLVVFYLLMRRLPLLAQKLFFLTVVASAVGPSVLLGSGYPPRFEYMNAALMTAAFLVVQQENNKKRSIEETRTSAAGSKPLSF